MQKSGRRTFPFTRHAWLAEFSQSRQDIGSRENINLRLTTNVLIGSIAAVLLSVAEQASLYARSVAASEETVLAERLLGVQQRFRLPLLILQLAVVHGVLPVAGLLVDVEVQASGTPDRLETRAGALDHVAAIVTLPGHQSKPLACILVLADLALEALLLLGILLPLHTLGALCN